MARRDTYNGMRWCCDSKRAAIHIRDGWRCVYCGISLKDARKGFRQLDHLFPVALGGDDSAENLVTACADCNNAKADRPLDTIGLHPSTIRRIVRQAAKPLDMVRARALVRLKKTLRKAA